jgi:hypothetical protein
MLGAQQIIGVWERGRRASSHDRALLLAELALGPGVELAGLAIGDRDRALAEQRIATYGAVAPACVVCPACSEGLEFRVDFAAVCGLGEPGDRGGSFVIEIESFRVEFRLPSTADLLAITQNAAHGRAVLIERIILVAEREGDRVSPSSLPVSVIAALEAEIERLDPISDIRFGQTCPACQHRFVAPFDVARFCWHELDVDARRLLQEVDVLARVYGWSEAEILALSRARRSTYLEICGVS